MRISVNAAVETGILKLGCGGLYTSAAMKLWKNNWFAGRFTKNTITGNHKIKAVVLGAAVTNEWGRR
ncbi:hypothetical protein TH5_04550 [Thalassospira xianhensis MCCC 1A02616]|uniref:Uncharacterized protein n=1 Tax=Thalassospira xianhensis MCCC 1A02616 TaxID=1177929 RepID=A0A367UFY6_9PROT|nr:hypothetical protein TH5_04550 [Thalassospira xianhensis MCCC 1A02616]